MEWQVVKTYTKQCGCECDYKVNDVHRPFTCHTEYDTIVTKRCDKHSQEHEEYCAKLQAEREREKQIREEQLQLLKVHIHNLTNVEHTKYAPIKEAVSKHREYKKITNSDRWIQRDIMYYIGDLLMIQKIRNKWVCCKDRLEYCDFSLIFGFGGCETRNILKSFAFQ